MTETLTSNIQTLLVTSYGTLEISTDPSNATDLSTSTLYPNISVSEVTTDFIGSDFDPDDAVGNPYADDVVVNAFQMVLTVVITLCGCVGNTLVILAVFTHRRLRNLGNAFVVNLAVADLCVSAFINAFAIAGLVTKGAFFETQHTLCQAIGVICVTSFFTFLVSYMSKDAVLLNTNAGDTLSMKLSTNGYTMDAIFIFGSDLKHIGPFVSATCSCSMWSIASIGVNRYFAIVHRVIYHSIYNKRTLPFLIATLWGVCFLIDLPNLAGWGGHVFEPKLMLCTYDYTAAYSYTFFFIATGFGIPVGLLVYSYVRIVRYAWATAAAVKAMDSTSKVQSGKTRTIRSHDRRLLRSVLTIVVVFLIMWTPYAVIVVFDRHATWPRTLYVVALLMAHMNSSINSILYGATNKNFREAYSRIVCVTFTCGRRRSWEEDFSAKKENSSSESNF